jgi:hypothetical protein
MNGTKYKKERSVQQFVHRKDQPNKNISKMSQPYFKYRYEQYTFLPKMKSQFVQRFFNTQSDVSLNYRLKLKTDWKWHYLLNQC